MGIDLSKLPPWAKIEVTKADLLAFAAKLIETERINVTSVDEEKVYFNMDEAAEFLRKAKQTLYGMTSRKEIKFFKSGKNILFKKSDLIAYIESGKQKTRAEGTEEVMNYLRRKHTK